MSAREFAERMCIVYDYYNMSGLPIGEVIDSIHAIESDAKSGDFEQYKEYLEDSIEEISDDYNEWYHNECVELLDAITNNDIRD